MRAAERLAELSPDGRAAALAVLDDLSRPLTPREIEDALRGHLSRGQRRAVLQSLKGVAVIAILPERT